MFVDPLVEPLRAVCVLDPAIDRGQTSMRDYVETRNPALIVELPGQSALWCIVRPLSVVDFGAIDSLGTEGAKLMRAFAVAVERIENFQAPGVAYEPTQRYVAADGRERAMWGQDELQRVANKCGVKFLYEIGLLAYQRALSGNGWSGSVRYMLPQSSEHELALIERLRAERARVTSGTSSSAKSPGPAPTP